MDIHNTLENLIDISIMVMIIIKVTIARLYFQTINLINQMI